MKELTTIEKKMVGRYIRENFTSYAPRDIRFWSDGAVTGKVDWPIPSQKGRMFFGWDTELLAEAKKQ